MGGQMGPMNQQRMHAMQAQRMQMQSQQHMQQMQQQQMGIEGGNDKEENAYSSEIVTKGSGIKLKIKLKKTAEEEAAAKKSRKRKPEDDLVDNPSNSGMTKSSGDKFESNPTMPGMPQGSMMPGSGPTAANTSSGNMSQATASMGGMNANRPQALHQHGARNQSPFTGMNQQHHQQQ